MNLLRISIPADLPFSALRLRREPDGSVSFDTSVVRRILEASGIDPDTILQSHEDNLAGLIVTWYDAHRRAGGDPDPTADDLIAEAMIEDEHGQSVSHRPGRA